VVFEFEVGWGCGVVCTPVTDQNAGREAQNRKTAQHSTETKKNQNKIQND
jgi:hypothetical protein